MDRLGRRGDLFLDWASAAFGDGESCGSGELSEDNSSFAGRLMSSGTAASLPLSGRDGGSGRGGPRDFSAWLACNRVRRSLLSSRNRFACSRNSATCLACSSCLASISWRQRRNWSSRGRFSGLLDMTVSSDSLVGCSRIQRLRRLGDHLGAGVPKLSRITSEISCSTFPTDGTNCSLRNSQSQWIVGAFTSHQSVATCKINKKTTVVFRCPSNGKVSFVFGRLRVRTTVILIKNVVPHLV